MRKKYLRIGLQILRVGRRAQVRREPKDAFDYPLILGT